MTGLGTWELLASHKQPAMELKSFAFQEVFPLQTFVFKAPLINLIALLMNNALLW